MRACIVGIAGLVAGALSVAAAAQPVDPEALRRGEYLFNIGGCAGCHTDVKNKGPLLGGGRALKTPFGTFYGPNITADPQYGIGRWSDADFIRAMREGIRADGAYLFPVFPYTSFTRITDADLRDLKAYIFSLPPVVQPSRPHEVSFPFRWRFLQIGWRWLNFARGPFVADPERPAELNRGAYLVQALGHCGECHTPRNLIGGLRSSMVYAGTRDGPEGERVPNITTDRETGIGKWSDADLGDLLKTGMTPDGDFVGSAMAEVVNNSTGKLNDADIKAVIAYLRSLPSIVNDLRRKPR